MSNEKQLCCQNDRLAFSKLPFDRIVIFGFFDGPLAGVAQCCACKKCYYFNVLEWETYAFCRVFGFAPIEVDIEQIEKDINWWTQETKLAFEARRKGASDEESLIPESTDYIKQIESIASQLDYSHLCVTRSYLDEGYWRKFTDADKNISDWIEHLGIDYDEKTDVFQIREWLPEPLNLSENNQ